MLIHPDGLLIGLRMLEAQDFVRPTHSEMFDCLKVASERGEPVDIITITEELKKRNKLEDIGGVEYILACCETCPTYHNIAHYCRIVKDKSVRRQIAESLRNVMKHVLKEDSPDPVGFYIASAMACGSLRDQGKTWRRADEAMLSVASAMAEPKGRPIPYGITDLDKLSGGIITYKPRLIIIGARSSNGKTALLNMIAMNCVFAGYSTLYYSYETDAEDLTSFMASNISGVNLWKLEHDGYRGSAEDDAWKRYTDAQAVVHGFGDRLLISESNSLPLPMLCANARQAIKEKENSAHPVGCILVDYAQIVDPGVRCKDLRTALVTVVKGLKELTMDIKVPVVLASQITTAHADMDKSPRKENLAEAPGALIPMADDILILHNPPPTKGVTPTPRPTAFILDKHKRGMTGTVHGVFLGTIQRFIGTDEEVPSDE